MGRRPGRARGVSTSAVLSEDEEGGGLFEALGLLLVFALALSLHVLIALAQVHFYNLSLVDTDSYTRMLRVLQLWHGDGWYQTRLPQLSAPEGLDMHWSRPLDLMIIAPALPALLMGQDPALPLQAAGALICPVLHALACLVAVWAARGLWPRNWCWFAGLILALSPVVLSYSSFARADHHTLILLADLAGLGYALRAARGDTGAAWKAGVVFGLGVWVLPEVLLVAMPVLGAFGLLWLSGQRDAARQGARIALGMGLTIGVVLPIERAPSMLLVARPDRISIHHMALGLVVACVFAAVERLPPMRLVGRMAAGGAIAALGAGGLLLAWPQLLAGATEAADGPVGVAFVRSVGEMQPLHFGSIVGLRDAALVAGGVVPGVLALVLAVVLGPAAVGPRRLAPALVAAAAMAACLAATISARRFAVDLAAPIAVTGAGLLPLALILVRRRGPLIRVPVMAVAGITMLMTPSVVGGAQEVQVRNCDPVAIARWLATGAPPVRGPAAWHTPIMMADDLNVGPAIAYFTGLRLVGAPYHQAGSAIGDMQTAFLSDEARSREILARRQVSLLLVCTVAVAPRLEGVARDLRTRLIEGDVPDWLQPIPIPEDVADNDYRLFAVKPGALSAPPTR